MPGQMKKLSGQQKKKRTEKKERGQLAYNTFYDVNICRLAYEPPHYISQWVLADTVAYLSNQNRNQRVFNLKQKKRKLTYIAGVYKPRYSS